MNVLHLSYAVEVEKHGSISAAAEKLYMGQPNLSKAIRELENSINITLFTRTTKGVTATPQGKQFLQDAKGVLAKLDQMKSIYVEGMQQKQRFSISAPRASYITHAFTRFVQEVDMMEDVEFHFKETNTMRAIATMMKNDFRLGVIRYSLEHQGYYENLLHERGMKATDIWTHQPCLLFSKESALAQKTLLTYDLLEPFVEITLGDLSGAPVLPQSKTVTGTSRKKIMVYERGSQFELLKSMPNTYMWVSPVPEETLQLHGLMQRAANEEVPYSKDVLIYPKEYHLTPIDQLFINKLIEVKNELSVLL